MSIISLYSKKKLVEQISRSPETSIVLKMISTRLHVSDLRHTFYAVMTYSLVNGEAIHVNPETPFLSIQKVREPTSRVTPVILQQKTLKYILIQKYYILKGHANLNNTIKLLTLG